MLELSEQKNIPFFSYSAQYKTSLKLIYHMQRNYLQKMNLPKSSSGVIRKTIYAVSLIIRVGNFVDV